MPRSFAARASKASNLSRSPRYTTKGFPSASTTLLSPNHSTKFCQAKRPSGAFMSLKRSFAHATTGLRYADSLKVSSERPSAYISSTSAKCSRRPLTSLKYCDEPNPFPFNLLATDFNHATTVLSSVLNFAGSRCASIFRNFGSANASPAKSPSISSVM